MAEPYAAIVHARAQGSTIALATAMSQSAPPDPGAGTGAEPQPESSSPPPVTRSIEILLPLLIGDRYLGDVRVRVTGDLAEIDGTRLIELLEPELTEPTMAALALEASDGRVTPEEATGENLQVRYNRQLQQIEITVPASARELRTISMSTDLSAVRTAAEEKPAGLSLFATTRFTPEYDWTGRDQGFRRIGGQLDLGGRIGGYKGVAFLSRHSYSFDGDQPAFTREETALYYDDVERMIRVTAGDLVPRGTGFQSVPLMAGVSVERLFSLQPERLFRPIGNSSFQLDEPATVQVRINGVVQRELLLEPGRYNLRDLPLTQGSNLVDIVIRDSTGREIVLSDRNFFDFDLLAPGITEFSGAVGVRSGFGTRAPTYSNDPIFTGFARRGLSDTVTAGVELQVDDMGGNGGAQVLWASPIGVWRLQAAGSTRSGFGTGAAAEVGYRLDGVLGGSDTRFSFDLRAEHRTRNFATVADTVLPQGANQPTATIFNASGQLFFDRVTASATGSYSVGRAGRPNTAAAIVGATYQISPRWSLGLFGRHLDNGEQADTGAFIQLVWRPSQDVGVRARYDTINRETQIGFRRSAQRTVGSLSYGADVRYNDRDEDGNASADAFYVGNRFEASVSHRAALSPGSGGGPAITDQRTRLSIETSVAFADGAVTVGRPVRDSFAIVDRHPTLGLRDIKIDQTERGYVAATDFLGPALVTELSGYSSRSIYYSVEDLPPGYDLGTGQFVLRPPLNAGYRLTVGTDASYSLIGSVRMAGSGEGVAYLGGALYSLDDPTAEPVPAFTNRNGRLVAVGLKAGRYRLELNSVPPISREIVIPDGPEPLVEIGVIEVEEQ